MRKFILTLPLMFLSSCATGPLTPDQIALLTQQIQAYTATACAFQPTAASVVSLISAFYEPAAIGVGIVNAVGDAICKAPVTQAVTRRGTTTVTRAVNTPAGVIYVKGATYGGSLQHIR